MATRKPHTRTRQVGATTKGSGTAAGGVGRSYYDVVRELTQDPKFQERVDEAEKREAAADRSK